MSLTVLELCAGYNGLGMAVEEVFSARTVAFSEYDAAPSKILAHHYPDVPNYGDMTKIDWAAIEQADIISGGTPCQDLSAAGRRAGMNEGTRSNLWVQMREAIAIQKPKWVVWENVRGAFSACASSEMGQCPGCVDGRGPHKPFLRALGRVLGDLSDLGYDTQWRGLRAADVGGCHGRFRVFVLGRLRDVGVPRYANVADVERGRAAGRANADPQQSAGADRSTSDGHRTAPTQDTDEPAGGERRLAAPGPAESGRSRPDTGGRDRTPATDAAGGGGHECCGGPADADADGGHDDGRLGDQERSPEQREAATGGSEGLDTATHAVRIGGGWREAESGTEGSDDQVVRPGPGEAAPDNDDDGRERIEEFDSQPGDGGEVQDWDHIDRRSGTNWGEYESAIRRWEQALGRPAPRPTEPTGRDGGERLSPRFTEWMMGLPDGWVTDPAIGISRNEQLKACGNGVVPQQAIAALSDMLAAFNRLEAAA